MYQILFTREAQKALTRLPRDTATLLRQKFEQMALDPYAPMPNAKRLQNRSGYSLRIGDWRVLYEIQNDQLVILVLKIAQRGEVYR